MCRSGEGNCNVVKGGGIIERVKHEQRLCNEVETVREFTYLGDGVE